MMKVLYSLISLHDLFFRGAELLCPELCLTAASYFQRQYSFHYEWNVQ